MEIQKTNIDKNGELQSYMPVTPTGMVCEHPGCNESKGKDYIRKEKCSDGWDDEPIYLCDLHCKGHEEYK